MYCNPTKQKITLAILILTFSAFLFLYINRIWNDQTGYSTPTDLKQYGITGEEASWPLTEFLALPVGDVAQMEIQVVLTDGEEIGTSTLLSLREGERLKSCLDLLDESLLVVDKEAEYARDYRYGMWFPYRMLFTLQDGTVKECGISIITEPSRVLEADGKYWEMLAEEDLFPRLEEEYGMKPYPDTFEMNRQLYQ